MKYNDVKGVKYSLKDFINLGSNEKAIRVVNEFIDSCINGNHTGKIYRIIGPSGMGKTHLLYASAKKILARVEKKSLLVINTDTFQRQLNQARLRNEEEKFLGFFLNVDGLLLDDIELVQGNKISQKFLANVIDSLIENKKSVLLTSNPYANSDHLHEISLRGQIDSSVTGYIDPIYIGQISKVVSHFCYRNDINIEKEARRFIASNYSGSIKGLIKILDRLIQDLDINQIDRTITKLNVEKVLSSIFHDEELQNLIFIQVPPEVKTPIKQYFEFFNDYISWASNEEFNIEIRSTPNGLILETQNTTWSDSDFKEAFSEYISYLKLKIENISFTSTLGMSDAELKLHVMELKHQIDFLRSSLEFKNFKIEFLEKHISSQEIELIGDNISALIVSEENLNEKGYFSIETQEILKSTIARGGIDEVFSELLLTIKGTDQNDLIVLNAAWNRMKKNKRLGIIDHAYAEVETNSIVKRLLEFIDLLFY